MDFDPSPPLNGFAFKALFQAETLKVLDNQFLENLYQQDKALATTLLAYREDSQRLTSEQISELLLAGAIYVEDFIAQLFAVQSELFASRQQTCVHNAIFDFKKWFIQRRARRRLSQRESLPPFSELETWLTYVLTTAQQQGHIQAEPLADRELAIAQLGRYYLAQMEISALEIEKLTQWCISALTTPEGQAVVQNWVSFHQPQRLDYDHLVTTVPLPNDALGRFTGPPQRRRQRTGFRLTDKRMSVREVLNEINYCIYCHDHNGDFCARGFPQQKDKPEQGYRTDPLGVVLTGCPLGEKISEANLLKRKGHTIAALAMVMADNPLCPLTGHRICNDCMRSCIYQKQQPVNIPQIETRLLTDVLALPYGVEIYDLLTRWNPLRKSQWLPRPYNGLKVLIAGQGPAGMTLAHHLLMEGFAVVGIDGLKIEPLPARLLAEPILNYSTLEEELDERIMAGFGGVAEYGITVRWDKNFLKLLYLSLSRRPYFQVFGNVRFGGTVTVEDAWELGFDHLAIAVGAGLPQALPIPGSLAPGMRQANDFLMALQLTGAAKYNSLANLQVRLPAVVIGGGLTAIDTATEVQAYYLVQIEKTLQRYEQITDCLGEGRIRAQLDDKSLEILCEFLAHGRELRAERERAKLQGTEPDVQKLLQRWGGVTVAYRRSLRESPAYIQCYEEINKAFEEGIYYVEGLTPTAARLDAQGHVQALVCQRRVQNADGHWSTQPEEVVLPARSIFVATGAHPNVAYEFEHRGHFQREGFQYRSYQDREGTLQAVSVANHCKEANFGPFTSYQQDDHRVSFVGDAHPSFHGSVVKAIASSLRIYPHIVKLFGNRVYKIGDKEDYAAFRQKMHYLFQSKIVKLQRKSPSVLEIQVFAPLATEKFMAGQFFRVQNYETFAPLIGQTRLQTEATAVFGAGVDKERGIVSLLVIESGTSSRLYATLRLGEPLSLMGPTGAKTKIPAGGETILVIGTRLSAISIRTLGAAWRAAGNRVLYVVGFQTADELYDREEIEAVTDVVVWVTACGEPILAQRQQDYSTGGDLLTGLIRYAAGQLDNRPPLIPLAEVTQVFVIGGNWLVRTIQEARQGVLGRYFAPHAPEFTASIYSSMQCMLKGVCAQCLQWQIDPATGERTKAVFTCSWHHQPLDILDIDNIDERLSQNALQEQLTNLWLDHLLTRYEIKRI